MAFKAAKRFSLSLQSVAFFVVCVRCFNVDVREPVIYEDPSLGHGRSSYFGWTVALHNHTDQFHHDAWVIVGAPRANDNTVDADEPGVLYKCSFGANRDNCRKMFIDIGGRRARHNAWLGASMDQEEGPEGNVVVCAPRWHRNVTDLFGNLEAMRFNGACYMAHAHTMESDGFQPFYPLHERGNQRREFCPRTQPNCDPNDMQVHYYYLIGQAGFSCHFAKSEGGSRELIIGAPGVFNWAGTVIRYFQGRDRFFGSAIQTKFRARKKRQVQLRYGSGLTFGDEFEEKFVGNPFYDNRLRYYGYFGYAVTSGKFLDLVTNEIQYAASAPRSHVGYRGQVFIFTFSNPPSDRNPWFFRWDAVGSQMGENFGVSLASVDLNGDGFSDLVVGAPMHSLQSGGDEGRIYIYLSQNKGQDLTLQPGDPVMGSKVNGARFGSSLSTLGDLNHDGFQDLAVGAPYEDDGAGAVYIFMGSKDGIHDPVQRIRGKELSPLLRGFGISIGSGKDMDNNQYPDLGIGSYISGHVVLLRTSPVIIVDAYIEPLVSSIATNDSAVYQFNACIQYAGMYAPKDILMNISLSLDTRHAQSRSIFADVLAPLRKISYVQRIPMETIICREFTARILPKTKDFSTPIRIEMEYQVSSQSHGSQDDVSPIFIRPLGVRGKRQARNPPRKFCSTCPVVDQQQSVQPVREIPFENHCGEDHVCQSKLSWSYSFEGISEESSFVIGSKQDIRLNFQVQNSAEAAFFTRVSVLVPPEVPIIRIPEPCQEQREFRENNNTRGGTNLTCELRNPLQNNEMDSLSLLLSASRLESGSDKIDFAVEVTTSSEDKGKTIGGIHNISLPLQTLVDFAVTRGSDQEVLYYSRKLRKEALDATDKDIVKFRQTFVVSKFGPSPISQVELRILFPMSAQKGKQNFPLFLIQSPSTSVNDRIPRCYVEDGGTFFDPITLRGRNLGDSEEEDRIGRRQKRDLLSEPSWSKLMALPDSMSDFICNSTSSWATDRSFRIKCGTVVCKVGPFQGNGDTSKLSFLIWTNMTHMDTLLEGKTNISYSSLASLVIMEPENLVQAAPQRPDEILVSTVLISAAYPPIRIPMWVWFAAAAGGLVVMCIIVTVLSQVGFFERKKRTGLPDPFEEKL